MADTQPMAGFWGTRRGVRPSARDAGFSLLETIISLTIVSLAIGAVSSLVIGVMSGQANLKHRDQATSIAQSTMEEMRAQKIVADADGCVPLLAGRSTTAVAASWTGVPAGIDLSTSDQTTNPTSCTGSGLTGISFEASRSNFTYQVKTWIGACQLLADGSDCVRAADHPTSGPELYRVMVSVEWDERGCPDTGCVVTNSELLDPNEDPTFLGSAGGAVAAVPDNYCIGTGQPKLLNVISNDEGSLGSAPVRILTSPSRGTLTTDLTTGIGGYQPSSSFTSGSDSFTYQLVDVRGRLSNTATVTIQMQASCP